MTKKYDAIIFDLGGVLYDIDVQRTIDAFAAIGIKNFEKHYTLKEQTDLFDSLEKGLIGEDEFVKAIQKISQEDLSDEQIKIAWNAILIGMPLESVDLLKKLKQQGYKLYLLSNTNIFHYTEINKEMQIKYGVNALSDLFDMAYYSFQMGMRKPDAEIFQKVISDHNLLSTSTIFIDDNADNINGSLQAGVPAILKTKHQSLVDLFKENQIL